MKIACLQFSPVLGDVDNNLTRADAVLAKANVQDLDLLVLPELAFTGRLHPSLFLRSFLFIDWKRLVVRRYISYYTVEWLGENDFRLIMVALLMAPNVPCDSSLQTPKLFPLVLSALTALQHTGLLGGFVIYIVLLSSYDIICTYKDDLGVTSTLRWLSFTISLHHQIHLIWRCIIAFITTPSFSWGGSCFLHTEWVIVLTNWWL